MTKKVSQIDGKFYQEAQVIMLPTTKEDSFTTHICKRTLFKDEGNNVGKLSLANHVNLNFLEPQHLYFISDEDIKEGDWYVYWMLVVDEKDRVYEVAQCKNGVLPRCPRAKIIATTDFLSLEQSNGNKTVSINNNTRVNCLPRPSNEFIQAYCRLGGIDKVLVKMSEIRVYPGTESIEKEPYSDYQPKIAQDNTITCKAIPEVFVQVNFTLLQNIIKYCEDQQIYDKLGNYDDFYYKLKALNKNHTG